METDFWQPYKGKGLVVVALNEAENTDTVKKYRDKHKLSYPILLDPNQDVFPQLMGQASPWNIIVDQNGIVKYSAPGFNPDVIKSMVTQLLSSPAKS